MKNIKKLIAAIIMCCFGAAIGIVGIFVNDNSKKEDTLIKWKENALVNPTPGKDDRCRKYRYYDCKFRRYIRKQWKIWQSKRNIIFI